ncbi:uncharacterized protein [Cicer arietinum]|uniref:RING-type E3 ubiquitin transferase n=1 Tax=Cicer arietinum TaxID=3827 RepID=A0A1S2Z0K8_CICAR|nr:uncharacterized protein LOC101488257 [Cicer arietinum]
MPIMTGQMKWRRPINKLRHPISNTEHQSSQLYTIVQTTNCKSTISSLFSSFSNNNTPNETKHNIKQNKTKNNNGNTNYFRGLGCTTGTSHQVSVPAVISSSEDWQGKKNRKKKHRRNSNSKINKTCHGVVDDVPFQSSSSFGATTCVDFQDVWCGPGIGFSSDASSVSVDCVVARKNLSSRGKLDGERITHRERSSYFGRRSVNPENLSFLDDDDSDVFLAQHGLESFGNGRFFRHASHNSSDGLAEIMIIQGRLMGGRFNSRDQFRDWRLDVDNMSYEQLLELGERIGYVKTGLKEDEMRHNIRKIKLLISNDTSKQQIDKKCSICQEEYELDDELGRLNCEHSYHFHCIKQWLVLKNFCPVCKQEVAVRH